MFRVSPNHSTKEIKVIQSQKHQMFGGDANRGESALSRPQSTASMKARKLLEIAAAKKKLISNIIWCIVVLACVVGCLGQVFTFLEIFWSFPTIIDIETEKTDELQFPAVTVCNNNKFRLSEYCKLKGKGEEDCQALDVKIDKDDDLFTLNRSIKIQMGHQVKTMIFETGKVVNGTVDVQVEGGGFREHIFHQAYSNCYSYNAEWSGSGMGDKERARQIDFTFTLYLEPKEYMNSKEWPGAQIVFHQPETIPDPQDSGIPIRAGYSYIFTLRQLVTRRLKKPYWTDCKDYPVVKRDRYIFQMTQALCQRECAFNASLKLCRCIRRDVALPYEVDWDKEPSGKRRFCDADIALTRCWVKVLDEFEKCSEKECKKQCWEDQYETSVTQDNWPDQLLFEEEGEKFKHLGIETFRQARANVSKVYIIFGTLNKITYKHRPKYEQIELFSYMGGFIGIWVGVSFLNVLDYATKGFNWLVRWIHAKKTQNSEEDEVDDIKDAKKW